MGLLRDYGHNGPDLEVTKMNNCTGPNGAIVLQNSTLKLIQNPASIDSSGP